MSSWQRQIRHPYVWSRCWLERRHRELFKTLLASPATAPKALKAELWCIENYLNKHTRPGRIDID